MYRARRAIEYFVFRIQRELGSMMAILSGLDALVFCGGIGENAWRIRERVCQGFGWIGLELDETRNRNGETIISSERSRVCTLIINTDEELMIARHTAARIGTMRKTTTAAQPLFADRAPRPAQVAR